MSNRYEKSKAGGWKAIVRAENVKNRGDAVAVPWMPGLAGPASPNLGIAAQGAAAEDPGLSRADDASESGVGSMKSGCFTQLDESQDRRRRQ